MKITEPHAGNARRLHARASYRNSTSRQLRAMLIMVLLGILSCTPSPPSTKIDATANALAIGTLWGHFSVTARGNSSYSIQIAAPPGTRKLAPKLALTYNNASANGMVGVGFGLEGLAAVTRTAANIEQDGFKGGVNYDANDRFTYSGHRLIAVGGTVGADGTIYREERDNWTKFKSHSTTDGGATCGSGPCWFEMVSKMGIHYEFGRSADSRIGVNDSSGTIRLWALDKITDLNGNVLEATYTQTPYSGATNQGQYYPETITYGGNEGAGVAAQRKVEFAFEKRPDPITIYRGGAAVTTAARLTGIEPSVNGIAAPKISITYQQSSATGRSLVSAIQQCSGDGSLCTPPTTFSWSQADLAFDNPVSWLDQDFVTAWSDSDQRLLSDVNGDGLIDIIGFRLDTQVSLATHTSFAAASSWNSGFGSNSGWNAKTSPISLADVNGDGLGDLVGFNVTGVEVAQSTGSTFDSSSWTQSYPYYSLTQGWDKTRNPRMMADVDGDGLADIIGFGDQVMVGLSKGNQFADPVDWNTSDFTGTHWWSGSTRVRLLGDVNGDGLADIVGFSSNGVVVGLSTGRLSNSFETVSWQQNASGYPYFSYSQGWQVSIHPRMLADVNGDGLSDIVGFKDGTQVALSTGKGFLDPQKWNDGFSIESLPAYTAKNSRVLVDVNGDGLPDILGLTSTGIEVALNQTSSFAAGGWNQRSGSDFTSNTGKLTSAGDVNGDGLNDFIAFGAATGAPTSVSVGIAKGDGAKSSGDLMTKATNGLGGVIDLTYAPMSDPDTYTPGHVGAGKNAPGLAFFATKASQAYSDMAGRYPIQTVVGGKVFLVKSVTETTDPSMQKSSYAYTTNYSYSDAKLNLLSQRWLGFATKTRLYAGDGKQTKEYFSQVYPMNGEIIKREISCGATATDSRCSIDDLMTLSAFSYESVQTAVGTGSEKPPVYDVNRISQQVDYYTYNTFNNSILNEYSYDQYGNVAKQLYYGDVDLSGRDLNSDDNVTTCKDYVNQAGSGFAWQLGYLHNLKRTTNITCTDLSSFDPSQDLTLSSRTYDTSGGTMNLLTDSRWDDQSSKYLTYAYSYDVFGNATSHVDPQAYTWTTTYDSTYHTFVTERASPALSAENNLVIAQTFNHDAVFGTETARVDANGDATITCLDGLGREIATQEQQPNINVNTDRNCLTNGVGSAHPVVSVSKTDWKTGLTGEIFSEIEHLLFWPTGGASASFLYEREYLDGRARTYKIVREGDPSKGDKVTCIVYDGYNRRPHTSYAFLDASVADCNLSGDALHWKTKRYDILGRIVERHRPNASDGAKIVTDTTEYSDYLTANQTLASGSSAPYRRTFDYKMIVGKRRLSGIEVTSDNNAQTTIDRDRLGYIVKTTAPATTADPQGISTTYTIDSLGRKIQIDSPDRGTITNDYGGTQNLVSITDANGTQNRSYDEMGRIIRKALQNGDVQSLTYDASTAENGLGRLTSTLNNLASGNTHDVTEDFGYDAQGNIADYAMALGPSGSPIQHFSSTRTFTPQRKLESIKVANGSVVTNVYQYGHLASSSLNGDQMVAYDNYDAFDRANTIVFGNNAVTETQHSGPTGMLVDHSVTGKSGTYLDRALTWSDIEELNAVNDNTKLGGQDLSQHFGYTSLRITAASGVYNDLSYDYDQAGNITSFTDSAATTDYTFTNFQLVNGKQGSNIVLQMAYDGVGSTVSRVVGNDSWSYRYTPDRLPQSASKNGTIVSEFGYAANGRRVYKVNATDGLTSIYVDSNYQLVTDSVGDSVETVLINGPDGPAVTVTTGLAVPQALGIPTVGTLFLHRNQVKSTILTTDSNGEWVGLFAYQPYGDLASVMGNDNVRSKFAGKELDEETNFYNFETRQLDPAIKRFLTADRGPSAQLTLQDALNTYAYVGGRPTSLTDPTGQQVFAAIAAAVAEVGAEAGAAAGAAAEGAAVAGEVGAATGEAGAAATATSATAETAMASETIGATSALSADAVQTTATTAARTATLDVSALSATTVSSGEIAAGESAEEFGSLADSTAFEGESSLTTCPSPCRGPRLFQSVYRMWAERPIRLYRAISNPDEMALLENDNILQSPIARAGGDARIPESVWGRFRMRFVHSLDSTGSSYVSTTSSSGTATSFAGRYGTVYEFEIPRGQLYRAWHSPYPWEWEFLAEDGARVSGLRY